MDDGGGGGGGGGWGSLEWWGLWVGERWLALNGQILAEEKYLTNNKPCTEDIRTTFSIHRKYRWTREKYAII